MGTDFVGKKRKKLNKNSGQYKPRKKWVLLNVAIETPESVNMNEYELTGIESVYFVF